MTTLTETLYAHATASSSDEHAKDIDVCYVEVLVSTIEHNDLQFVGSFKLIDKISQFIEYIRVD